MAGAVTKTIVASFSVTFEFHSGRPTHFEADARHILVWVYHEKRVFFVCVLSASRRKQLSQRNIDLQ